MQRCLLRLCKCEDESLASFEIAGIEHLSQCCYRVACVCCGNTRSGEGASEGVTLDHGYTRMHQGVDFAVPVGTPVMAAGAGVIKFDGVEHGYGNFLVIQHNQEYTTAYAHLSRFAPGIHVGVHVRQGQIVAYSGNTGLTTGPHLHYEVRVYGKPVNPETIKVAGAVQLHGTALRHFLADKTAISRKLASLPLVTRVAENIGRFSATRIAND